MEDSPAADAARRKIAAHFERRTRGETPVVRNGRGYLQDKWYRLEAGRPDGSELASYYMELVLREPERLELMLREPSVRETFELVMAALGIKPAHQR